jgi:LD-carboxypeptidase N-terminal domain
VWDDAPVIEATRFGRPLPQGGCIGVPAPASPWENRSDLLRGVEWWQARGHRVKLADGIEARDSYVAGDPKSRARDLEALFADPEVDLVQCLTGGFGSMQLAAGDQPRFRDGSAWTGSPSTRVARTRASPMGPAASSNGSRSRTARSASLPGVTEPVSASRRRA